VITAKTLQNLHFTIGTAAAL